jgi:hypothetical protein
MGWFEIAYVLEKPFVQNRINSNEIGSFFLIPKSNCIYTIY